MRTRLTRRGRLTAALVLTVLLAACGSTDTDSGGSAAGNTDVATGGRLFATADEETAKLGSDADPGQFPRVVTHSLGEVEITEKPQRVVVLDGGELDAVLSRRPSSPSVPASPGRRTSCSSRIGGGAQRLPEPRRRGTRRNRR